MIGVLLLVVATALLVAGAELFVDNAAGAARRLGVTVLAVGILLAGAEPEELITAIIASLQDRPGLAAGDAIGANVTMLTACLGLAALIRPLHVGRRVREYALLAAVAGALALLALLDGHVGRGQGALLLAAYVGLVALVWWREKEPPKLGELAELDAEDVDAAHEPGDGHGTVESRTRPQERSPATSLALVGVGIALMVAGGDVAVRGAVQLVALLDQSDSAIGLTLLALATTAELFALVVTAARHDVPEVAVAGVVGSAAYNATATLGAAALARPLTVTGLTLPAVAAAVLPLALLGLARGGVVGRASGAGLWVGYAAYLVLVLA